MIGTSIGRYQVCDELGQGGMSVVYRGVDTSLEREVAIKLLHSHLAKSSENRKRLHREAKAIARLKHPNILEIYDYGAEDDERAYIVMEYIRGQNLRQLLQAHGPLPSEHCAAIGLHLCRALGQAHAHGIVHRDLKPENVMVAPEGAIKLMDFGIAHIFDAETMTQTGSLMGSPAHMAPELIEGEPADARADIFALGTVLYLLATGVLPFEGKNAPQILKRVLEGLFKNPEAVNPRVGPCLGDIIRRCMAYQREDRYADTDEVARALEGFLRQSEVQDEDALLRTYLADPEQARASFAAALLPTLLRRARQAQAQGQLQLAFRLFNRILGYDPQHAEVLASLDQLQRARRPGRLAAAALALALTGSAALVALTTPWRAPDPDVPDLATATSRVGAQDATAAQAAQAPDAVRPSALVAQAANPQPATRPEQAASASLEAARAQAALASQEALDLTQTLANAQADAVLKLSRAKATRQSTLARALSARSSARPGQDQDGAEPARPDPSRPDPAAPNQGGKASERDGAASLAPAQERWTHQFKILPATASISIAQEQKSAVEALTQGFKLGRGVHQLRLSAPGCVQHQQVLRVEGAPTTREPLPIVLTWRPGVVQIKSDVPSTIFIDGVSHGTVQPGQLRAISFDFGKADEAKPERQLRVVLYASQDMTRSYTRQIRLRPGSAQLVQGSFTTP